MNQEATLMMGDELQLRLEPDDDGVTAIYRKDGSVVVRFYGNVPWTLYTQPPAANECPDMRLHRSRWLNFRASSKIWLHDRLFGSHSEW